MRRLDGRQVMKYTFDNFTYLRSSIDMPKEYDIQFDSWQCNK